MYHSLFDLALLISDLLSQIPDNEILTSLIYSAKGSGLLLFTVDKSKNAKRYFAEFSEKGANLKYLP